MISATIITLNEEKSIKKVLQNIKDLVNEVIVVDSGSTDKTVQIAEKLGAKVYLRKFDNFANQKNWALSKTTNDWILSLDADEEIPLVLADEIKKAVKNEDIAGYLIPRRNFILGKEIKYSRWSPDKHIWFWKKDKGKWVGEVHEEVEVLGKVGHLKMGKIHNSHQTLSDFINSNNFYSTLLSESMYKKGVNFSLFKMFWNSIWEFKIRFFYKLGFLDGWRGFVLAYLMAIYHLMVWVKLWQLNQQKD